MNFFTRAELYAQLINDLNEELEVEMRMYNDGITSDYGKITELVSQLLALENYYDEGIGFEICTAVGIKE